MNSHPDSDYMSLQVAENNARTLFAVDQLCWVASVAAIVVIGVLWWPL
ncbi:MAG: hypothetical protein BWZ07_02247 [Alphaproteobacteria bacterium ADurb.BinA280]|nr:MAG: hypothetical protein BWZ07_02247 [Alphaproteobacteria bacterium ADurb.BinA280]